MLYKKYTKRIVDFILSLIGLILLSPLFALIIIAIYLETKGPVFFKQKRIGKDKIEFNIYKFRTMRIDTPKETPTHLLSNPDYYITRIGRVLRKTSLDELPQLLNILKGDMAVIGPRPALWNQFDLISIRDTYNVNNIRPGLTGWAQINGRDELEILEKARLDGEYVEKFSFWMDIKCFFGTFIYIVISKGVIEGDTSSNKKS